MITDHYRKFCTVMLECGLRCVNGKGCIFDGSAVDQPLITQVHTACGSRFEFSWIPLVGRNANGFLVITGVAKSQPARPKH